VAVKIKIEALIVSRQLFHLFYSDVSHPVILLLLKACARLGIARKNGRAIVFETHRRFISPSRFTARPPAYMSHNI
jgi:hypothetical protein